MSISSSTLTPSEEEFKYLYSEEKETQLEAKLEPELQQIFFDNKALPFCDYTSPQGKGLMWEASLNGKIIYLIGGMHLIPHAHFEAIAPKLIPLAMKCQKIFFEVDLANSKDLIQEYKKATEDSKKASLETQKKILINFVTSWLLRFSKNSPESIVNFVEQMTDSSLSKAFNKINNSIQGSPEGLFQFELSLMHTLKAHSFKGGFEGVLKGVPGIKTLTDMTYEMQKSSLDPKRKIKFLPLEDEMIKSADKGSIKIFDRFRLAHCTPKSYQICNQKMTHAILEQLKEQDKESTSLFIFGSTHFAGEDGILTLLGRDKNIQIRQI
ncbi:hypothetical protein AB751O23_AP_00070 [Chlamydiales bacterium SCGC AB-751-O23]|jgi:uncharacterized protein YbaP (TraB family)|nr:hypothetical protein AB751O23_AP_00070 [Chlamydiales bacterium SCGC AB-751-O23]